VAFELVVVLVRLGGRVKRVVDVVYAFVDVVYTFVRRGGRERRLTDVVPA
jgi:hypothetical protein